MKKDQFNISDYLFHILVNLMYGVLMGIPPIVAPALGIPVDTLKEYLRLLTNWNTIYGITKNKSGATHTNIVAKDAAKLELADFLRPFVKKWLYANMPPCTDEIITSCGMKPHSKTRTNHKGKPSQNPALGIKPNSDHGFNCSIRNEEGRTAKPDDSVLMRIHYFEGTPAPTDPAKFTDFQDYSKIPIILNFPAESAGTSITLASCYVNKSGEEGGYSNIINTKIP